MNFLRKHWFDVGGILAVIIGLYLFNNYKNIDQLHLILYLSMASLLVHQVEEYRYPGFFPGMLNSAMYKSDHPDSYPLNTNTSFMINVVFGWSVYLLATVFAEKAIWLGIASMIISLGNFFAHLLIFNIKGRTLYNPGAATAILLFLPLALWFGNVVIAHKLASPSEWIGGITLGIALNLIFINRWQMKPPSDWRSVVASLNFRASKALIFSPSVTAMA